MKKMMLQLGVKTEDVPAKRVIIEKEDEKIVLNNPSVVAIEASGEKSYQISSRNIEVVPKISEEDIKLVSEQTGANKEECEKTLVECKGDVAEAILKLKKC